MPSGWPEHRGTSSGSNRSLIGTCRAPHGRHLTAVTNRRPSPMMIATEPNQVSGLAARAYRFVYASAADGAHSARRSATDPGSASPWNDPRFPHHPRKAKNRQPNPIPIRATAAATSPSSHVARAVSARLGGPAGRSPAYPDLGRFRAPVSLPRRPGGGSFEVLRSRCPPSKSAFRRARAPVRCLSRYRDEAD